MTALADLKFGHYTGSEESKTKRGRGIPRCADCARDDSDFLWADGFGEEVRR